MFGQKLPLQSANPVTHPLCMRLACFTSSKLSTESSNAFLSQPLAGEGCFSLHDICCHAEHGRGNYNLSRRAKHVHGESPPASLRLAPSLRWQEVFRVT
eukprot:3420954-Amphidinium_carterae.1